MVAHSLDCLSVHLSYHSILVSLGSDGLHDVRQELAGSCQHGGSSVHNGLAAPRAPVGRLTIDLESVRQNMCQKLFVILRSY